MDIKKLEMSEEQIKAHQEYLDKRPFKNLYGAMRDVESYLEGAAGRPEDVRDMSFDEIRELIRFEQSARETLDRLRNVLRMAEEDVDSEPVRLEVIDSEDHPIVARIKAKSKEASDRAAKIRRLSIRRVN